MYKKIIIMILILLISGCVLTEKKLTVEYKTGDKLTITLPRDSDLDIELTKDGKAIHIKEQDIVRTSIAANIQGNYDIYVKLYDNTSVCKNLENGKRENLIYRSYACSNMSKNTYIYIVKVSDSNLSLLLTNTESKESSKTIFDSLSFKVK